MLLAGLCHLGAAVALGNHDHRSPQTLEKLNVAIHASGGGRAKRPRRQPGGRFGRAGVIHRVRLEVIGETESRIDPFFEFGVRDVPGDDNFAAQRQTRRHGVLGEFGADLVHGTVEVDGDDFSFVRVPEGFGNPATGVILEFFQPDARGVDLGFDVAVCRAGHAHSHGAGRSMTGQANNAHVEGEVFAAELGADAQVLRGLEHLRFEGHVAEGLSLRIPLGGKGVEVLGGREFDRF